MDSPDNNKKKNYQFLLFYIYHLIVDPPETSIALKSECERLKINGRIRVATEGSNGIISGCPVSISQFKELFPTICGVEATLVHWYQSGLVKSASIPIEQQVFSSLHVQVTKEVVSLDLKADMQEKLTTIGAGKYLTPQEFHAMLSTLDRQSTLSSSSKESTSSSSYESKIEKQFELLDIRNHYEVRIGTFAGESFVATNPETRQVSISINLYICIYYH